MAKGTYLFCGAGLSPSGAVLDTLAFLALIGASGTSPFAASASTFFLLTRLGLTGASGSSAGEATASSPSTGSTSVFFGALAFLGFGAVSAAGLSAFTAFFGAEASSTAGSSSLVSALVDFFGLPLAFFATGASSSASSAALVALARFLGAGLTGEGDSASFSSSYKLSILQE